MRIQTRNINQGAFFTALGGKLISMEDYYPNTQFLIAIQPWMQLYEKVGLVNYRKYCRARIRLKLASRRHSGLSESFIGKKEGFFFGDVALVQPASEKKLRRVLKL